MTCKLTWKAAAKKRRKDDVYEKGKVNGSMEKNDYCGWYNKDIVVLLTWQRNGGCNSCWVMPYKYK